VNKNKQIEDEKLDKVSGGLDIEPIVSTCPWCGKHLYIAEWHRHVNTSSNKGCEKRPPNAPDEDFYYHVI